MISFVNRRENVRPSNFNTEAVVLERGCPLGTCTWWCHDGRPGAFTETDGLDSSSVQRRCCSKWLVGLDNCGRSERAIFDGQSEYVFLATVRRRRSDRLRVPNIERSMSVARTTNRETDCRIGRNNRRPAKRRCLTRPYPLCNVRVPRRSTRYKYDNRAISGNDSRARFSSTVRSAVSTCCRSGMEIRSTSSCATLHARVTEIVFESPIDNLQRACTFYACVPYGKQHVQYVIREIYMYYCPLTRRSTTFRR